MSQQIFNNQKVTLPQQKTKSKKQSLQKSDFIPSESRLKIFEEAKSDLTSIKLIKDKLYDILPKNAKTSQQKMISQFALKKSSNKKFDHLRSLITYAISSADKAMKYRQPQTSYQAEFALKLYYSDKQSLVGAFNNFSIQDLCTSQIERLKEENMTLSARLNLSKFEENNKLRELIARMIEPLKLQLKSSQITEGNFDSIYQAYQLFIIEKQMMKTAYIQPDNTQDQKNQRMENDLLKKQVQKLNSIIKFMTEENEKLTTGFSQLSNECLRLKAERETTKQSKMDLDFYQKASLDLRERFHERQRGLENLLKNVQQKCRVLQSICDEFERIDLSNLTQKLALVKTEYRKYRLMHDLQSSIIQIEQCSQFVSLLQLFGKDNANILDI